MRQALKYFVISRYQFTIFKVNDHSCIMFHEISKDLRILHSPSYILSISYIKAIVNSGIRQCKKYEPWTKCSAIWMILEFSQQQNSEVK